MTKPIGFFDSGVGGLSVLKVAMEQSNTPYLYIGDTLRVPYGVRTPEEVKRFTLECIDLMAAQDPAAVVIACNTATAYALKAAQARYDFPVIGVIGPGARAAVEKSQKKKIALLATEGTVKSGHYRETIRSYDPSIEVVGVGAPDLVVAIQDGHMDDAEVEAIIARYLEEFGDFDYDTLILGCTHFPLARSVFERLIPAERGVAIIDPAVPTVQQLEAYFAPDGGDGSIQFMATDDIVAFQNIAERVLDLSGSKSVFQKVNVGGK
ncbi:MAG: glutamate racemase [Peptoniphilaceae bacterium]|nr:glutamate racemase [Peptoniphilaceae bacterium]MDY6086119.1 glutamate racemase [Peptoniphilaceae bacterium]